MRVKVCVLQHPAVFFDKAASLSRMATLVTEHAAQGCQLILFPESFIPGYPRGFTFGAVIGNRTDAGRDLYARYRRESVDLAGPDRHQLEAMARDHNVWVVAGVTEREELTGTLYCSMVYLSPTDGLVAVHRKLKATGTERLVWGDSPGPDLGADAGTQLVVKQSSVGRIGGLICWENYMPLARMELYRQGVQLYLAPTADSRSVWLSTMRHIALEGRCFVLGCNQYFTRSMYPEQYQKLIEDKQEVICPGGSVIVSPLGEVIAGPLIGKAGALIAEIDLEDVVRAKLDFDVIGHYGFR